MLDSEKALQRFVADNRDLEELESLLSEFNLFEAMGVSRQELRHSDFLAFLLAPNQSHRLGDSMLKRILHRVISSSSIQLSISSIDVDVWSLLDVEVRREWLNIDILLISRANSLVVTIENKIDSREHSNQLQRYREIVVDHFPGAKHVFILLSRYGVKASDKSYASISYSDVADVLQDTLAVTGQTIDLSVRLGVEHYMKMLRRHIVNDSQIAELCRRIYHRHRQAIDLIVEHSSKTQDDIYSYLMELVRSDGRFILDQSPRSYVRFTLPEWDVPGFNKGRGWTSSRRLMLLEFQNLQDRVTFGLLVGPGDPAYRRVLIDTAKGAPSPFANVAHTNRRWTHLYLHQIIEPEDWETLSFNDVVERINHTWERFTNSELPIILSTMEPALAELEQMERKAVSNGFNDPVEGL